MFGDGDSGFFHFSCFCFKCHACFFFLQEMMIQQFHFNRLIERFKQSTNRIQIKITSTTTPSTSVPLTSTAYPHITAPTKKGRNTNVNDWTKQTSTQTKESQNIEKTDHHSWGIPTSKKRPKLVKGKNTLDTRQDWWEFQKGKFRVKNRQKLIPWNINNYSERTSPSVSLSVGFLKTIVTAVLDRNPAHIISTCSSVRIHGSCVFLISSW